MKKVLLTMLTAVLMCCACTSGTSDEASGTDEEKRYDAMLRKTQWEKIVEEAAEHPIQSQACYKVLRLAQFRLGQAGKEAIMECLLNSRDVLSSETAALMMSDVYFQLSMVNMAQRAAFEALVTTKSTNAKTRALQRLTETALVTGQYEIARKYISILEEEGSVNKWLKDIKPLAEHPERIEQHPVYQQLRQNHEKVEDQFFL
jgi:DNA polymerase III psi subunit